MPAPCEPPPTEGSFSKVPLVPRLGAAAGLGEAASELLPGLMVLLAVPLLPVVEPAVPMPLLPPSLLPEPGPIVLEGASPRGADCAKPADGMRAELARTTLTEMTNAWIEGSIILGSNADEVERLHLRLLTSRSPRFRDKAA